MEKRRIISAQPYWQSRPKSFGRERCLFLSLLLLILFFPIMDSNVVAYCISHDDWGEISIIPISDYLLWRGNERDTAFHSSEYNLYPLLPKNPPKLFIEKLKESKILKKKIYFNKKPNKLSKSKIFSANQNFSIPKYTIEKYNLWRQHPF